MKQESRSIFESLKKYKDTGTARLKSWLWVKEVKKGQRRETARMVVKEQQAGIREAGQPYGSKQRPCQTWQLQLEVMPKRWTEA